MSRLKKVLSVVLLLTFWAGGYSLSAFAQSGGAPSYPDLDLSSKETSVPSVASPAPSPASPPPAASTPPPPSSSRPSGSSKTRRTAGGVSSSSAVSSGPESGGSSFEVSSEESSGIALPSVGSVPENDPLSSAVVHEEDSRRMNWIGILSWACIALGILVVLIVILSNRHPPRGTGRKRYRRTKRPNKKRLLNDKYYRNINRY